MELLYTLAIFYAWQCVVLLPPGSAVFVPSLRRAGALRENGLRLLSPWPSALGLVSSRLPFDLESGGLRSSGSLARFGGSGALEAPRWIRLPGSERIEAVGSLVKVEGRRFVRAASGAHARHLRELLSAIASAPERDRPELLASGLAASLCDQDLGRALERARANTRVLGWSCNLYWLLLFAVTPALVLLMGAEPALFRLVPAFGLAHLASLVLLHRAQVRIDPEGRVERWERFFVAALFPPALLRAPQSLVNQAMVSFHPLALALRFRKREVWIEGLRRDLVRLECQGEQSAQGQVEREALLAFAERHGVSRETFFAPRHREDPMAASYCPLCLDDFRPGFERCQGCGVETVAYQAEEGEALLAH